MADTKREVEKRVIKINYYIYSEICNYKVLKDWSQQ